MYGVGSLAYVLYLAFVALNDVDRVVGLTVCAGEYFEFSAVGRAFDFSGGEYASARGTPLPLQPPMPGH